MNLILASSAGMDLNSGTYWGLVVLVGVFMWIRELMK